MSQLVKLGDKCCTNLFIWHHFTVMDDRNYKTTMLWLLFVLFVNNVNAQGMLMEFQMFYE